MKYTAMCKYIIGVFILLFYAQPLLADGIVIKDSWVREAPPNSRVLAGYFTLLNDDKKDHVIISTRSKDFVEIEIHLSKVQQGMMKMEKQDKVLLPKGEMFHFKPGGYHLMLIKPKRKLRSGDKVEIILELEGGREISDTFIVRKDINKPMQSMHHHQH
jgi:copper(I)-binding protein